MTKLNQIVAVEKGLKGRATSATTSIYHALQKAQLFGGLHRVYTPIDDAGEQLPPESKKVQLTVEDQLKLAADHLTQLFDVVATKETGNLTAMADVVVDGETLLPQVPITYLLFLEKQLTDVRTVFHALPVLDPSDTWTPDAASGTFKGETVETLRTKKTPRNHVKAEATDRHPAQVEVFMEDVPIGKWRTTKLSGAVTLKRQQQLIGRIDTLLDAVKKAREEANGIGVQQVKTGDIVFGYLLA